VNILRDFGESFRLAEEYGGRFVQMDAVAGHLAPEHEAPFVERLAELRSRVAVCVLGGVRFKYQPYDLLPASVDRLGRLSLVFG
jgi:hypothetical protein